MCVCACPAARMIGSSAILCFALVHLSLTGVHAVQLRSHVNPTARITETTSKIEAAEGALAQLKERASAIIVPERKFG